MVSLVTANQLLSSFSKEKVPLIGLCQPRLITIDDHNLVIKIPLNETTQNHLGSMYFGALAVGADVAAGFLAMYLAKERGLDISLAFKSFDAKFLKRPEADVHFIFREGDIVSQMLDNALRTRERINQVVGVTAMCPTQFEDEVVAEFNLELSIKVI